MEDGRPIIDAARSRTLASTRYLSLYDLAYEDGGHYYVASRRDRDGLLALAGDDARRRELPDAVSCCLVLAPAGAEPRMVLLHEYRYPIGGYVMGIPSGLVDAADRAAADPLATAMEREIGEECGLLLGEDDRIWTVNPLLYNTPGLTDESTALLCAVVRQDSSHLSQAGAEGSERFAGFSLMTADEVRGVLERGLDPAGNPYPLVCWAAMTYFACGLWRR